MASRLLITGLALSFALGGAAAAAISAPKTPSTLSLTTHAWSAAISVGDSDKSCARAIGLAPARALVRYCRYVSAATHPPCNSQNSCALIVDEIQRTTVGNAVPLDPHKLPGSDWLKPSDWRTIARLRAY